MIRYDTIIFDDDTIYDRKCVLTFPLTGGQASPAFRRVWLGRCYGKALVGLFYLL